MNRKRACVAGLGFAGLLFLLPGSANAQSFTVQDGQTVGPQVMTNPGDVGTIEAGGTINGGGNDGVHMQADSQTVVNDGLVTTTGFGADGILSDGADATIRSQGTIRTTGNSADGIASSADRASIIHSGSISTVGVGSLGIESSGADATINITGTITTGGLTSDAIRSGGDNLTIHNSGTLSTFGQSADGIEASGDNAVITNTGTITTRGFLADGIEASGDDAHIFNCGTIRATGTTAFGILSYGDNGQVTNCGTVISEQASAIEFQLGEDNILTLLPGSVIEGGIRFAGGTDTLVVGNGLSIANTFDKAPEIIDANGAPFAVSGNQVAVMDPTMLSTQEETFADLMGGISGTVLTRLSGLRNGGAMGVTASRPMHVGEAGADVADRARQYWVQGFGGYREQPGQGASLDTDQQVAGLVSGMDAPLSAFTRAGFFLGGSWGEVETSLGTQSSDIDSFFGGAYLSTLKGRNAFDLVLTVGRSDYEGEREVANNLAAGGLQSATYDYDGWFISPELTLTRPFWALGQRIEKVLTLRYAGLFLDSYGEEGAADALTMDAREIHLGVARAALALPFERQSEDGGLSRLTLTGGIEGRTQFGDDALTGTLLAQTIVFTPGGDDDVLAGFASLTGEHTTPGGLTAFIALEGQAESDDAYQVSARGGVRVRF